MIKLKKTYFEVLSTCQQCKLLKTVRIATWSRNRARCSTANLSHPALPVCHTTLQLVLSSYIWRQNPRTVHQPQKQSFGFTRNASSFVDSKWKKEYSQI